MVLRAAKEYEPSVIAKYALRLAKAFNKYYANVKVLVEDSELPARLAMVKATTQVLTKCAATVACRCARRNVTLRVSNRQ